MSDQRTPLHAVAPSQLDFGTTLRLERERRGITLRTIAERTKVSASLFAALERNDLSRWPGGIFRRSFVRGYAGAVGLDPEELLCRFLEAFPDEEASPAPAETRSAAAPGPSADTPAPDRCLRLSLDEAAAPAGTSFPGLSERLLATAVDLALPMLVALLALASHGMEVFWPTFGIAACVSVATFGLVWGERPASLLLRPRAHAESCGPAPGEREPAAVMPLRRSEPALLAHRSSKRERRLSRARTRRV